MPFFDDQILTGEIGHAGFGALRLGRAGRVLMRLLYRVLGPRFATMSPEATALFRRNDLRRRFRAGFRLEPCVQAAALH